jgi:endoglucanase
MKTFIYFILMLSVWVPQIASCKKSKQPPASSVNSDGFFKVNGTTIMSANGQQAKLQGVAFGNEVWSDKEIPNTHHGEVDYERVKDMGMNAIRFYINYKTLEDDANPYQYKQTGWSWIDQNIAWAKKYGIYLIINMHVPQGGFQSLGNGDALWSSTENQQRLSAMWRAIANKYKDEKQVVGFGLLNEPVPTTDILQWQQLAQRIANEIRAVDKNHILFVERAIYVKGKNETADYNFITINDSNTAYEFHIYDPFVYTHQLFSWASPTGQGEGGKYPDESIISFSNINWYTATFNNPKVNSGTTNWTYVEGEKYKITDSKIKLGMPALVGAKAGGRVYFDNVEIKEYDANGNYTKTIMQLPITNNAGWYFWSSNNSGSSGLANNTGYLDNNSMYIEGTTDDCNLSNALHAFQPLQGYSYQINGWMKGDNISGNAACLFRIDFYDTNDPVQKRNKALMESILKKFADWGKLKNVPIYMGEFGAGIHCFQNNKGGLQWVSDMIDIAKANNFYFTYHTYHEDNFGLYFGYGTLPDPTKVNQPLIDLFKQKLR